MQKTGDAEEDRKRFSHKALERKTDNRCTPFATEEKRQALEELLYGSDPMAVYLRTPWTTREKKEILNHPDFKDIWEAQWLDLMFGKVTSPTRLKTQVHVGKMQGWMKADAKSGVTFPKVPEGTSITVTAKRAPEPISVDVERAD